MITVKGITRTKLGWMDRRTDRCTTALITIPLRPLDQGVIVQYLMALETVVKHCHK